MKNFMSDTYEQQLEAVKALRRRPQAASRGELPYREYLAEAHHEGDVTGHLVLAVHESVTAALLAPRDGQPEVGVHGERDRRLHRATLHHPAGAVADDHRPLPRLAPGEIEQDDRLDAGGSRGIEHLL